MQIVLPFLRSGYFPGGLVNKSYLPGCLFEPSLTLKSLYLVSGLVALTFPFLDQTQEFLIFSNGCLDLSENIFIGDMMLV